MTISSDRARDLLGALLVAGSLCLSSPAAAQPADPTATDLESARELYREGKDLRQKGDLPGALERFKAAHGYGQTPVTGLELGKTYLQLGDLVEAREVFLSIGRLKVASDETEKSASARDEAADLAEQIRPRIPTLIVKVSGLPPDVAPQVLVDGAATPSVSGASMRKINPGDHAVVVRAGGREEKRSVALAESETKEVPIAFTDASPKIAGAAHPPGDPDPSSAGRSIHVLTWVGLATGGAGLALGSVAGILALSKANSVNQACTGLACPASAKKDVNDGRVDATVSTIAFAVGGAGLALAAVAFFALSPTTPTPPTTGATPSLHFAITPTWSGIHGAF